MIPKRWGVETGQGFGRVKGCAGGWGVCRGVFRGPCCCWRQSKSYLWVLDHGQLKGVATEGGIQIGLYGTSHAFHHYQVHILCCCHTLWRQLQHHSTAMLSTKCLLCSAEHKVSFVQCLSHCFVHKGRLPWVQHSTAQHSTAQHSTATAQRGETT